MQKIKLAKSCYGAKEDANTIIRELETKPDSRKSNELRKKLNGKINDLSPTETISSENKKLNKKDIKIGLDVKIPSFNQIGTIISTPTKNDTVQVQIGSIKTYFNISDLEATNVSKKQEKQISQNKKLEFKIISISPEINVIGQNVEEACFIVDKYLDTCVLNGLSTIRIIHGKGTRTLKKGIHNFIKKHPHVKSYRLGTFGEGEDGVTVVELK